MNKLEQITISALKLLTPLTPDETYKIIIEEAVALTGASYGSVILTEDGAMKRVYASQRAAYISKVRKRANAYKAYTQQKILVIPIEKLVRAHPELIEEQIKFTIFIPLSYQKKAIGVLVIHSKNETIPSKESMHLLTLFGAMATLAIRKTQLYTETKNALETRDYFISLASHELRTPLTSINGYIQLLYNKMLAKDDIESKWVKELYSESKRLTNLVTELLEINRIKQGQLQFNLQECSVHDFITQLIVQYHAINPDRRLELHDKTGNNSNYTFIGDSTKLLQVFTGLLNNADKFSPLDAPVIITVKCFSAKCIISISDKGSGISREDFNKIFVGFYKGKSNEQEGLGVGLLLAKHIIQYHHGTINLRSKVKKGTTVEVKLPVINNERN